MQALPVRKAVPPKPWPSGIAGSDEKRSFEVTSGKALVWAASSSQDDPSRDVKLALIDGGMADHLEHFADGLRPQDGFVGCRQRGEQTRDTFSRALAFEIV